MFPDSMPWYKSRILIGALVSITMKILIATGVLETVIDSEAATDAALLVIGGFADIYIMYSRATQKAAPELTK